MHRDKLKPEEQKAFDAMLAIEEKMMQLRLHGKPVPRQLLDEYHRLGKIAKMSNGGFTSEDIAELR